MFSNIQTLTNFSPIYLPCRRYGKQCSAGKKWNQMDLWIKTQEWRSMERVTTWVNKNGNNAGRCLQYVRANVVPIAQRAGRWKMNYTSGRFLFPLWSAVISFDGKWSSVNATTKIKTQWVIDNKLQKREHGII